MAEIIHVKYTGARGTISHTARSNFARSNPYVFTRENTVQIDDPDDVEFFKKLASKRNSVFKIVRTEKAKEKVKAETVKPVKKHKKRNVQAPVFDVNAVEDEEV